MRRYEVTGTEITKYYFAGAQRITLRKDGALNFIIGDHLGSSSLMTDAGGNELASMRAILHGAKFAMKAERVPPNIPIRDNTLTVTLTCSGTTPGATEQKALRFMNRSAFCSRKYTTGGPDGRKFQHYCDGIELLPPGIQKSEALTILDYRRKRDLK
ncbi:MAG: hypothetical protein QY328_13705 [Anaerolineales bacterium]|nr:MAG: hypothetical protein QY328_13705 [Anaerolineales bacterium]